jgi:hypothetical protein
LAGKQYPPPPPPHPEMIFFPLGTRQHEILRPPFCDYFQSVCINYTFHISFFLHLAAFFSFFSHFAPPPPLVALIYSGGGGGHIFSYINITDLTSPLVRVGLSDFTEDHVVVVVGGCEGSAVLGVVNVKEGRVAHKLQLRGTHPPVPLAYIEGGCEGGACHYSVVSLMIDKLQSQLCAVLLSTGQLNVIHLVSGDTVFHR